jgi:uncharacterized protein YbbC (DUF1343 family)
MQIIMKPFFSASMVSLLFSACCFTACAQKQKQTITNSILPGAYQTKEYLPLLTQKRVAIFANPTSEINGTSLVDSLQKLGVNITTIFAPEHGFRGNADAGEKVDNYKDAKTGIQVVSLYGNKHYKPTADELKNVDILIFDIQDVGVRFYTFISSLEYFLEAAYENDLPLIVLDRPNPNGFYVDGPLLNKTFKSFVGMQAIPVVYGMTIGEYAKMLLGENLFAQQKLPKEVRDYAEIAEAQKNALPSFSLTVIKCKNYNHKMTFHLPVKPSPNLPNLQSILLYPSTCYFEGTDLSLGRGTPIPFQCYGHPSLDSTMFSFTPQSVEGAKNPPQLNKKCYGEDLSKIKIDINKKEWQQINLKWLLKAYQLFPEKQKFFLTSKTTNPKSTDYFFNKLVGNDQLMNMMQTNKTEKEIRASWQADLKMFKKMRKKYLLYVDFE